MGYTRQIPVLSAIPPHSIGAEKIAPGAIGADELQNAAVTGPKIAGNAVTTSKIADGAVGASDIGGQAVTADKLAPQFIIDGVVPDNGVGASKISRAEWGTFNVRAYGADPTGASSSSAAVAAAIADAAAVHGIVYFPPGTYKLTQTMPWDSTGYSVVGQGAVLDCSAMSAGPALSVSGYGGKTLADYAHNGARYRFQGFKIVGPDTDATTVDCIYIDDAYGLDMAEFRDLVVYGFRDQVVYDSHNWLVAFHHCVFSHAHRRALNMQAGAVAGEQYGFVGCVFSNTKNAAGTAVALYTEATSNAEVNCFGCSFDYNDAEIDHNSGAVSAFGCHFENDSPRAMFRVSATGGQADTVLSMYGGQIGLTEVTANARSHLFEYTGVKGDKIFASRFGLNIVAWSLPIAVDKWLGTGVGPTIRHLGVNLDVQPGANQARLGSIHNVLHNGDFELNSFAGWGQSGNSIAPQTVQTAVVHGGTYAAKIAGTGTAGISYIYQSIPCRVDETMLLEMWVKVVAVVAGFCLPRVKWYASDGASLIRQDDIGVSLSGDQDWQRIGNAYQVPKGAASARLELYCNNLNGAVYFDDIVASLF